MWANDAAKVIQLGKDVVALADSVSDLWKVRYGEYFKKLQSDAKQRRGRSSGFSVSGAFSDASNVLPSEQEVVVELRPSSELVIHGEALRCAIEEAIDQLRAEAFIATHFATGVHSNVYAALKSSPFVTYCRVAEAAALDPQAFLESEVSQTMVFEENLLDDFSGSALITGPAGYGKTTFCRWHAIRDANKLVQKQASILPVYRALHPLSRGTLGTFEETFFPEDEL